MQHMLHIKSKCGPRFWYIDYLMNLKESEGRQALTVHISTDSLNNRLRMLISNADGSIPLVGCQLHTGRASARNCADLLTIAFRVARDIHQSEVQVNEKSLQGSINPNLTLNQMGTDEYYVLTGEKLSRNVGAFQTPKRPISKSGDFPAGRSTDYKFSVPFTFNEANRGDVINNYSRIVPLDIRQGLYHDHHFYVKVVEGDWRNNFISAKFHPSVQFTGFSGQPKEHYGERANIGFLLSLYSIDETYDVVKARGAKEPTAQVAIYPLVNVMTNGADLVLVDKLQDRLLRKLTEYTGTQTLLNEMTLRSFACQFLEEQGIKDFEVNIMTSVAGFD